MVGVGFKLIRVEESYGETTEDLTSYLDLVATAIGTDIVPGHTENRILAYYGLKVIVQSTPWISGLNSKYKKRHFKHFRCGFVIAPRINAEDE